ncbi:TlpA disulfide reductase family protein [Dyadobacter sp. NIV53]|uniref:TlpA family protein disulfide reductase n=1 Tax=Dyadobacter sp. NIV53 TaxID=2861765 RepID=UPI001C883528|nr:TlpA disulfide reductase family protein [Dyadobacter sp. NIV53]
MDNGRKSQFFYDMDFILGYENESFQDEYLTFLTKQSKDRKEVLSVLLEMALVDPEYKDELEQYYNSSSMTNSFASYWSDAINKGAKDAYPIVLNAIDKQSFSSTALAGKWILVDFWGTWCVPCREEHPDLQKLYDSTIIKNPDHISLMTIACFDQDGKVSAYMKEKSYSFPVAMSDNKIEKTYLVQGYPTKILITPAGKYITIPYNIDWVSFVRKYTGLN